MAGTPLLAIRWDGPKCILSKHVRDSIREIYQRCDNRHATKHAAHADGIFAGRCVDAERPIVKSQIIRVAGRHRQQQPRPYLRKRVRLRDPFREGSISRCNDARTWHTGPIEALRTFTSSAQATRPQGHSPPSPHQRRERSKTQALRVGLRKHCCTHRTRAQLRFRGRDLAFLTNQSHHETRLRVQSATSERSVRGSFSDLPGRTPRSEVSLPACLACASVRPCVFGGGS